MKQFDHEQLEVYHEAIKFIAWLNSLIVQAKEAKPVIPLSEILNQIDRASISVVLNIAEGNGRRLMKQRIKFFDDARGSATECAACLDILVSKRIVSAADIEGGKRLLLSEVSMLSKLINYFEKKFSLKEDAGSYELEGTED